MRQVLTPLLVIGMGVTGCESVTEVGLKVMLPEDSSDLADVDNLLLILEPDGSSTSVAIDGLDFSVELEIPENSALRASIFLAEGAELRAWGRTTTFLSSSATGLAVFLGRPGKLSTFPGLLDDPDPDLLAAALPGRGLLMLDSDGESFLLNEFNYVVGAGPTLEDPPPPEYGGLYTTSDGALRLAWGPVPRAALLGAEGAQWSEWEVSLPDESELGAQAPAATNVGGENTEVFVYGENQTWRLVLSKEDDEETGAVSAEALSTHDGPRPGAKALGLSLGENSSDYLVFGSPDDRPVFWSEQAGAFGPVGPWTGGRCVQVDPDLPEARVLCTGGSRAGETSSDLLIARRDASGDWTVDEDSQALPVTLTDPLWLHDETALYAQSDGQLVKIARDSLLPDNDVSSAQRFAQGHSVELPTGATFLVGGLGNEGQPLTRWQVFMPAFEPSTAAP
jgi:hypothetical protein